MFLMSMTTIQMKRMFVQDMELVGRIMNAIVKKDTMVTLMEWIAMLRHALESCRIPLFLHVEMESVWPKMCADAILITLERVVTLRFVGDF